MNTSSSLESRLAEVLPKDVKIRAYHISTPVTATDAIFSAPPGQKEHSTQCESHFLGISSPQEGNEPEVFVFAIEVLIFTTDTLTTVFISKADSSGFIRRLHLRTGSPSVPQTITKTFIDYLLEPRFSNIPLVLSLFARSQHSYLFPGSKDNPEKHILDDRQLIKWWCKVLDSIWQPYDNSSFPAANHNITAHVVVPGCDKSEFKAFFPRSSHQERISDPRWINSYPIEQLSLDPALPLRCLIPRLPDDPKSRFLKDLDGNSMDSNGQWRSIRTIEQFWEMMSYRQECSAGRLVGFVWIVFSPAKPAQQGTPDPLIASSFSSEISASGPLPTPANSQRPTTEVSFGTTTTSNQSREALHPVSPPPSSPVLAIHDRGSFEPLLVDSRQHEGVTQDVQPSEVNLINEQSRSRATAADEPSMTPGQVVISAIDYELLIEELLEMDFAGSELAGEHTSKWLAMIAAKANVPQFGHDIVGRKVMDDSQFGSANAEPQINTLTGIRKKRKVTDDIVAPAASSDAATPQTLSSNLVRKKPKINGKT